MSDVLKAAREALERIKRGRGIDLDDIRAALDESEAKDARIAALEGALETARCALASPTFPQLQGSETLKAVRAALAPAAPAKCIDCGVALNEGTAKCFTVCDSCWDKAYARFDPRTQAKPAAPAMRSMNPEERAEYRAVLESRTKPAQPTEAALGPAYPQSDEHDCAAIEEDFAWSRAQLAAAQEEIESSHRAFDTLLNEANASKDQFATATERAEKAERHITLTADAAPRLVAMQAALDAERKQRLEIGAALNAIQETLKAERKAKEEYAQNRVDLELNEQRAAYTKLREERDALKGKLAHADKCLAAMADSRDAERAAKEENRVMAEYYLLDAQRLHAQRDASIKKIEQMERARDNLHKTLEEIGTERNTALFERDAALEALTTAKAQRVGAAGLLRDLLVYVEDNRKYIQVRMGSKNTGAPSAASEFLAGFKP